MLYLGLALLALRAAIVGVEVGRDSLAKAEKARIYHEAQDLFLSKMRLPPRPRLAALQSNLPAGVASLLASVAAVPGLKLVPIPAGRFRMGMPASAGDLYGFNEETSPTLVTLTRVFFLGATNVTQAQYVALMGSDSEPIRARPLASDLPIDRVTWDEAVAYCEKLTAREQAAGRLPAGWKFTLPDGSAMGIRLPGGTRSKTNSTSSPQKPLGERAWYRANSGGQPHPVATKQPNAWGLYDMEGNVPGWCLDWYGPYPGDAVTDPTGPANGTERVIRGGSWAATEAECRSAFRAKSWPEIGKVGFRVALVSGP